MNIEVLKIDKKLFDDNIIVVKLGSDDRPATDSDILSFQDALKTLLDIAGVKNPSLLITHHLASFDTIIDKEKVKLLVESMGDSK